MKLIQIICLLFVTTCVTESAKILGVFHVHSYSHYILGNTLLKSLAARGHEVTMISSFDQKPPVKNYRTIFLDELLEYAENTEHNMLDFEKKSAIEMIQAMENFSYALSNYTLGAKNVQKLLKSNEKFDLIIMEQFLNEAFRGFQYHYKAPCIIFSTIGANTWVNSLMGNSENPSHIPDALSSFTGNKLSFLQRVQNTLLHLISRLHQQFYMYHMQNEIMHKYFPDAPYVTEFLYNTSLVLLNSHPSYSQVKPTLPNMIDVGGMHVKPAGKLPEDLQKYLDDAKEGVIYFSLGGNVKSKFLPEEKRRAILNTFSKLNTRVLWKFEDDSLKNISKNVRIQKWFPQQEILAHPNVKLFITHGGLLSTIETIYHGKPVLGIPIMGDQKMNMQNAINNGYAVRLDYKDLNEANFGKAINEILSNKVYAEKAKLLSTIMHDQQVKPLDKAIYWVEYVLRYNGAPHLRSNALDLKWYQYYLLDVILLILAPFALLSILVQYVVIKRICKRKEAKQVQEKNKDKEKKENEKKEKEKEKENAKKEKEKEKKEKEKKENQKEKGKKKKKKH